ncbi:MAG: OmpH family outer membrane protein [Lentimicrobiaceae bacterium]|jgi:outer membrane protein|nr:OmpH family outer membrane protein [Lentimicrobiaceae bacterium]MCP4909961.1 OmpH family outer membrane protein [Bacteroidota bacterium]MBT3454900.1 OmpH family outer membrane protein [Lentimicrobiaceae bacterium]MBT3818474.1 OmpH family outer membrane protein [Lentimicrobiaceae bacterium]MBT4060842.1 OmpH family outer membrane protein [Lentimicrobiaceae bacterium]
MKNLLLKSVFSVLIATLILTTYTATAQQQKYAYVDTQYILDNIPEFQDAQDELDEYSKKWQKEIEDNYGKVSEMYQKYQAEAVLLPEDIKRKREEEIIDKEKEVKELQQQYFGKEGDLFKKRQELIQPIQEKVYNAIETIASTSNYSFVFDKAGGMTLLYGNPKYDISDDVLDEVGNVMQTVKRDNRGQNN